VPEFEYRAGELHVEGVPLARVAAAVGTPVYCYSSAAIENAYRALATAFAGQDAAICYAVKANSNLAVIATLARLGAGADVVSEGELRRALAAGVPPERIVFSGVGKSAGEIAFALDRGIHQINVESENELETVSGVATRLGRRAAIAIRVNPDVDARTHAKISTGKSENKFGIDLARSVAAFRRAAALPGIEVAGVAVHIGSQLASLEPFRLAFTRVVKLVRNLEDEGIRISRLDLGGGIGIRYRDEIPLDVAGYAAMVKDVTAGLDCRLTFEPGRLLVGNAGVLLASVIYVKQGTARRFGVLDAAMNVLIRPARYDAWHDIVPVNQPEAGALTAVDVVGPVCETGDTFAEQRMLPPLEPGALVAFRSAGAYGAVMSSTYNSRLLTPEVLVRGDAFAVIRRRPSYDDLLSLDEMPEWLAASGRKRGAA
jgi:diaminopimelate decarboxylase